VGLTGNLELVMALPDGQVLQTPARVVRCGPHRMLQEADEVEVPIMVALQRNC
jgi:hypothetical protein